ncbi:MAG: hypothetical protein GXP63_04885 [DPANN group archaeon]|nr:hypothetical protein [DPANN group archaeon]
MCFTPLVSLTTALIEFFFAAIILLAFRKSTVTRFMGALIIGLGTYQFTEFMLCTTGNAQVWGTMGFLTYTILPAIGLHFVLRLTGRVHEPFMLYIPTIIFESIALFSRGFIIEGTCTDLFVQVKNTLFYDHSLLFLYTLYYFGYILMATYLLGEAYREETDRHRRRIYGLVLAGILVSLLPPLFLIILFPAMSIIFPSVYCEFALFLAAIAFLAAHADDRHRRRERGVRA